MRFSQLCLQDDSVIPTLNDSRQTNNVDVEMKKSDPRPMDDKECNENNTLEVLNTLIYLKRISVWFLQVSYARENRTSC